MLGIKNNHASLEAFFQTQENTRQSVDHFASLIEKYENYDHLTIAMLNEFVEKILVHERAEKGRRETTQEIDIYFNFIGNFVPPHFGEVELTPEEQVGQRKREELRARLHQNYLKRKANGKQKLYEENRKDKRRAEIAAMKQAIREEDMTNVIYVMSYDLPKLEPKVAGVQDIG